MKIPKRILLYTVVIILALAFVITVWLFNKHVDTDKQNAIAAVGEYQLNGAEGNQAWVTRRDYGAKFEPIGDQCLFIIGQSVYEPVGYAGQDLMQTSRLQMPMGGMVYVDLVHMIPRWWDRMDGWYFDQQSLKNYWWAGVDSVNNQPEGTFWMQLGLDFKNEQGVVILDSINVGQYDTKLSLFLGGLDSINRNIFLRVGYEFNIASNGYDPTKYKAVYKKLADSIRARKLPVALVWCWSADGDLTDWARWYPGDSYVDWWSLDVFASAAFTYSQTLAFLDSAHAHGKPVLLGESSPRYLYVQNGQSTWNSWFMYLFGFIHSNPGVKAFSYIGYEWEAWGWTGWGDATLYRNEYIRTHWNTEMSTQSQYVFYPYTITSVQTPSNELPTGFELRQNYPNPFNPSTTIKYEIPKVSHVTLKVFDVLGREVAKLIDRAEKPGYKSVEFDGSRVSSGVYFYRLTAGEFVHVRKLLLLR